MITILKLNIWNASKVQFLFILEKLWWMCSVLTENVFNVNKIEVTGAKGTKPNSYKVHKLGRTMTKEMLYMCSVAASACVLLTLSPTLHSSFDFEPHESLIFHNKIWVFYVLSLVWSLLALSLQVLSIRALSLLVLSSLVLSCLF